MKKNHIWSRNNNNKTVGSSPQVKRIECFWIPGERGRDFYSCQMHRFRSIFSMQNNEYIKYHLYGKCHTREVNSYSWLATPRLTASPTKTIPTNKIVNTQLSLSHLGSSSRANDINRNVCVQSSWFIHAIFYWIFSVCDSTVRWSDLYKWWWSLHDK